MARRRKKKLNKKLILILLAVAIGLPVLGLGVGTAMYGWDFAGQLIDRIFPENPPVYMRRGDAYRKEGKYAEGFARLLNTLGSQDLEPFARAAHVSSTRHSYNFGRALFCNFVSDDLETVQREYIAFMRRKILGER